MPDLTETTRLLRSARQGDGRAADALLPLVYDELRGLAAKLMAMERPGHTLQPTALVNEVYLKLVDQDRADWQDHVHFYAVAAQGIRRILIDHARGRGRRKRGGDRRRVAFDTRLLDGHGPREVDLVDLDDLLHELEQHAPEAVRIIELRFFGGLTMEQSAKFLGVSLSTAERQWRYGRAWLFQELVEGPGEGP